MSVKVMAYVWELDGLSAVEKLTLLALADHANDDGHAYPSMSRLSAKLNLTERGIRGVIRRLEGAAIVRVQVARGRGRANDYWINLDLKPESASGISESKTGTQNRNVIPELAVKPEREGHKTGTAVPPNHQEPSIGGGGERAREEKPVGVEPMLDRVRVAATIRINGHSPPHWSDAPLGVAVDRWRALSLTDDEIVDVARATAQRLHPEAMQSPAYLDRPMQRMAGQKHNPPLAPDTGGIHAGRPSRNDDDARQRRIDAVVSKHGGGHGALG